MAIEDLRQRPMMSHMLDALDEGEDIGHYGRLVFVMIGLHFVGNDELVDLLTKDHDADEGEIGYSPPRREKILEYQSQQDFPICPHEGCGLFWRGRLIDLVWLSPPDEVMSSP